MNTDKLLDIYTLKLSLLSARELRFSGGLKLAVARSDDGSEITFALYEEQQVDDAAPQAEQEGPLQGPEGEALPSEGGVGGESPLPDALPQEGKVVEGVGGETERDLRENPMGYAAAMRDNPAFGRDLGRAFRAMTFDDAPPEGEAQGKPWTCSVCGADISRGGFSVPVRGQFRPACANCAELALSILADSGALTTDVHGAAGYAAGLSLGRQWTANGVDPVHQPSSDEAPVNPAWKKAFDLGALISTARAALDDLQVAACRAIDDCDATEGQLVIESRDDTGEVKATVAWPDSDGDRSFVARFFVEGKLLKVEE